MRRWVKDGGFLAEDSHAKTGVLRVVIAQTINHKEGRATVWEK
jgi:hypothetical protein